MAEDRDTISVWPQARGKWDWSMVEKFEKQFDPRNQAILEAMHWRLMIEDILGDEEWWQESDARARRMAIRQAVVDLRDSQ